MSVSFLPRRLKSVLFCIAIYWYFANGYLRMCLIVFITILGLILYAGLLLYFVPELQYGRSFSGDGGPRNVMSKFFLSCCFYDFVMH